MNGSREKKEDLERIFSSFFSDHSSETLSFFSFSRIYSSLLTLTEMGDSRFGHQWCFLLFLVCLLLLKAEGGSIPITIVETAKAKGAVCLDGSPPAYHMVEGSGSGINNWLVHMEGGGWCGDIESCLERKDTYKGSSSKMEKIMGFSGLLGEKQASNPDFYNWNRIKIKYCDGSSFTGDVETVDPKNQLYFRGDRIWQAVIDDLLAKGMKNAQNAILSGCSAGGLAAILHCDRFKSLLPATAKVGCVSDAGYFIHGKDVAGGFEIENFFGRIVGLHGSVKSLPPSCTSKMKPEMLKNIMAPSAVDPKGTWKSCKFDITKCSADQLKTVQDYRTQFLNALSSGAGSKPANGYFIDSCYAHCQSGATATWFDSKSPQVNKTKIGTAVGDWFFNRAKIEKIDCPYPCNPTCVKVDSDS
ncbi:pectin acetylesterase 7 isoform X2 [Manihot esculenta]|uniref:pectin acetylesterase 7 isoform X2 n=1 Tax=Manihot esculenta TaxID=3983 RepID=UPI001CC61BF9|nr:pectin acetylesterase 7 isoform X2 [Manihot esculenta]